LELLIYGHLVNAVIGSSFFIAVYLFCSSQFYVRVLWFILWFAGVALIFVIILFMLKYKLWTWILIVTIPADILLNYLAVSATKTCDRLSFLHVSSLTYCAVFESYRFLSLISIVKQESRYEWLNSWNLRRFVLVDYLCIFIAKSEIIYFVNKQTSILWAFSETQLLAARVTRGCVNLTALCFPIWWFGFELGRFMLCQRSLSECKRDLTENIRLLLLMHYGPELVSELSLILMKYIYAKYTDYRFERINFIRSLESGFMLLACGLVPGLFLAIMIILIQGEEEH